jgi:hypothetical protein
VHYGYGLHCWHIHMKQKHSMHMSHPGLHHAIAHMSKAHGMPKHRAHAILASNTRHEMGESAKTEKIEHTHTSAHKHTDGYGYHH